MNWADVCPELRRQVVRNYTEKQKGRVIFSGCSTNNRGVENLIHRLARLILHAVVFAHGKGVLLLWRVTLVRFFLVLQLGDALLKLFNLQTKEFVLLQ